MQDETPEEPRGGDEAKAEAEMERLHPFTLVHRLIVSVPALVVVLLPVLRRPDANAWISVAVLAVYAIAVLPLMLLQYFRFRYAVTPDEIIIHKGVFTYQHRNIPIERIQNIEIEQSLLPRMLGTAKVKVETAGSRSTEGVIEYVTLERARAIRASVRAHQRALQEDRRERETAAQPEAHGATTDVEADVSRDDVHPDLAREPAAPAPDEEPSVELLYTMPLGRVLLSGVFRFSLLYIAMIFTATEYLGVRPEDVARWISGNRMDAFEQLMEQSTVLVVLSTILTVGLLAWITGILTNLGRFYGFRLGYEDGKLHTRHGLLTVSEGTVPLKKIQALIVRTNPLMQAFGWYRLELQTMGFDPNDRGYRVAAPFARKEEILSIAQRIRPFTLPEQFRSVSRIMIRRSFVRYTLVLLPLTAVATYFWEWGPWLLLTLPLLYAIAERQYHNHGFDANETYLFVRRGVFRRFLWILPAERFQVFYLTQTIFQRRLGVQSLFVDTPGSGSMAHPIVVDLPEDEARSLFDETYSRFQRLFEHRHREREVKMDAFGTPPDQQH